jgi:hypothetical protein
MLTSVRASCRVPQKLNFANAAIFVEYKATFNGSLQQKASALDL